VNVLANAETVITADEGVRGGRTIPLKKTVDEAVSKCSCVKRVFVYQRTGNGSLGKNDISLDDVTTIKSVVSKIFVFHFTVNLYFLV
jgi:acyl-coenzyme A synthetase/AMP-(fatty) acid ligase